MKKGNTFLFLNRKCVSSDIQTPRSRLKNSALLLSVWISDETHFLVFDILHHITYRHFIELPWKGFFSININSKQER